MKKIGFMVMFLMLFCFKLFSLEVVFEGRSYSEAKNKFISEAISMSNNLAKNYNVLMSYFLIGTQQMNLSDENKARGTHIVMRTGDFGLIYMNYNTGKKVVIIFNPEGTTFPGEQGGSRQSITSSINDFLPD